MNVGPLILHQKLSLEIIVAVAVNAHAQEEAYRSAIARELEGYVQYEKDK